MATASPTRGHQEIGLCNTSRSGRARDCPDARKFPYYPSKQERCIFDFVFFQQTSVNTGCHISFFISLVPTLGTVFRGIINAGSMYYNVLSEWKHIHETRTLILIVTFIEASVMLVIILSMLNYGIRFFACCWDDTWERRQRQTLNPLALTHTIFCARLCAKYLRLVPYYLADFIS